MEKKSLKYKKILIIIAIWGALSSFPSYAVDVYMTDLRVSKGSQKDLKIVENSNFSSLLKYELAQLSRDKIVYKGIRQLSEPTKRVLKSDYVTSKIDALVVCHFEKINYLIYGTLDIDAETNKYSASLEVYGLEKNEVIHKITLENVVGNEYDFIKELSSTIDQDVDKLLLVGAIKEEPIKIAAVIEEKKENGNTEPQDKKPPEEIKKEVENKTLAKNPTEAVTPSAEENKKEEVKKPEKAETGGTLESVLAKFVKKEEKEEPKPGEKKPAEKLLSIFTSLGYFVPFSGEWTSFILPCISIEEGIKYSFYLTNTEGFDFIIRPAAYINYTFALNPDLSFLIHYHTLKLKGSLDAYFEFANFFAFYAGGGLFYRFDIIDFETTSGVFRTDMPYALGTTIILGVEFYLNKEKTYSLGLVNVLDMTFYSQMIIEYEILAQISFKL